MTVGACSAAAPTSASQHRRPVVVVLAHLDVAGFQPALHESGGGTQPVRAGGVVADQPLGQYQLVNHERRRVGDSDDDDLRARPAGD